MDDHKNDPDYPTDLRIEKFGNRPAQRRQLAMIK
jgi:hypothetical protein